MDDGYEGDLIGFIFEILEYLRYGWIVGWSELDTVDELDLAPSLCFFARSSPLFSVPFSVSYSPLARVE